MKSNTTLCRLFSRTLLFSILFLTGYANAQSIPVYATTISSQDHVDFATNATDSNLSTRARVRASSGIAIGIGAYQGHIELQFPSTVPANTTSYVKIQTDDNLLPSLLGGSLGGLLSDVLGVVLIGNQEFTVQAKNGNTPVLSGSSETLGDFASSRLRIVINANNEYFIALTPSGDYNRIRLTNRVGSLIGLGNTKRLDVYDAFYIGTPDSCGGPSYTSYDGYGLNLDLLGLGGAGVANPHHVLDGDPLNYSRLSLGIINVAGGIEQTVHFDGLSQPGDVFYLRLRIDPSLLALGVANNIQIVGANGPNTVQTVNLNSLLNLDLLTLLQGNQVATIPYAPNAPVNRITVRYNSLLNVQLTQSLDFYGVYRAPAPPVITDSFTADAKICAGSTASLIAESTTGTQLNWYTQPVGGIPVATVASGAAFVTPVLTEDTVYYVSAKRIGCPEESLRTRVEVDVIALPVAADINLAETVSACNGNATLSPTSSIGGATFRYYKDQSKTQEVITGYAGDPGVAYVKDESTGQLQITGLNATDSPYQYYISLTVEELCENASGTLKPVTVNFSSGLTLEVNSTLTGCGSVNLADAIVNFDNSADIEYLFFDGSSNPITAQQASNITTSGTYSIQMTSLSGSCSSDIESVVVTVNPQPSISISASNVVVMTGSSVTLEATSTAPITWYYNGTALGSNTYGPFSDPGFYTFTAIALDGPCSATATIVVTVIDADSCPPLTQRRYATTQSWSSILTGGVANASQAVDGNPQTHSTIVTGLGLLGVGTTWQTLQWPETIPAGTPVHLKLGSEYSGLTAIGAYSVVGTKRNGSGIPVDIGVLQPASGSLVDLLSGESAFDLSFVPSDATGPKAYDGVRIVVGSLLSIAQNVKVYEAYYDQPVTQIACGLTDVEDVYFGAIDLGIGAATSTVGVADAFEAVDGNEATSAVMYSGLGVLAAAELTVSFRTPSFPGDTAAILVSHPVTLLDLGVLAGLSFDLYMGESWVATITGAPLLSLSLLSGGDMALLTIGAVSQPYDRIRIRFGGVASVLDQLLVHEITRHAGIEVENPIGENTAEACPGETVNLIASPDDCTTYLWYDAEVGGTLVSTGLSYAIPEGTAAGTYTFYIQTVRYGCEVFGRKAITVIVGQTTPGSVISEVSINDGSATTLCDATNVVLQAQLDGSTTLTNPVFYWYLVTAGVPQLVVGQSGPQLVLSGIAPGTYTYQVGVGSDEFCPTAVDDRATVTFTVLPSSQPTDIVADDVLVCQGTPAVITPTSTLANPVFSWYFTNDNSQPVTNGTVGGITYAIDSNGTLTITGLTVDGSPYTYFVGLTSDSTCLNQAGNFAQVQIIVNDLGTPTTNDDSQEFCAADTPTLADISVNEPNVVWYDAPSGGNLLPDTTSLVDGTSYYAGFDASTGCGSSVLLEVAVTIHNIATPTTTDTTQEFCTADNPTIADLQVNESNIVWYAQPTGGTPLEITALLVDGAVYHAAILDAATGCESTVRLAITVTLNDTETPTTTDALQDFCLIDAPTVADIQVNETAVTWYDAAAGGNAIDPSTALVNGAVYYASQTVDGCESSVRLEVSVNVNDPATPTTTDANQDFCLVDSPTVADLQVNQTNVVWYDAQIGGNPLDPATALTSATYYAAQIDGNGCESTQRLEVAVTVNDPQTPTTADDSQEFCESGNPTVGDLQINETNILWYDAPAGGNQLPATTALVDGGNYYAVQVDENGCESSVRLMITVTLLEASTPTTSDESQEFCLADNPTVANLQVNESGVIFFATPTGGTPLASDDPLQNATYYAAFDQTGCASDTRLAITVSVHDVDTPTTADETQEFCSNTNPTITDLQVNETNIVWYNVPQGGSPLAASTLLAAQTYYASQVDGMGCESTIRLVVTVSFADTGIAVITGDAGQLCVFDQVTYTTTAGMTDYSWTVSGGEIVSGGTAADNSVTIRWMVSGTGTVSVSYTNSCGATDTGSLDVTAGACSDITITKTVDNPTPSIGDLVTFTIVVNNVGAGGFMNIVIDDLLPSGYQFVSATVTLGTYNQISGKWQVPWLGAGTTATLTIVAMVLPTGDYLNTATVSISDPIDTDTDNNVASASTDPICLVIYNEFSPNNDNANDVFVIDCIEAYPDNKLEVYNRYGALVYSKNRYENDWDGTANVSGALNKEEKLPTGTYYYILTISSENITKKGWMAITR